MSNYWAIGTVTAALEYLFLNLKPQLTNISANINITTSPPSKPAENTGAGTKDSGTINLFLFRVVTNPARANADLPTRRTAGSLAKIPQAALDLHYLITC